MLTERPLSGSLNGRYGLGTEGRERPLPSKLETVAITETNRQTAANKRYSPSRYTMMLII